MQSNVIYYFHYKILNLNDTTQTVDTICFKTVELYNSFNI
jgi:hypothetical protein